MRTFKFSSQRNKSSQSAPRCPHSVAILPLLLLGVSVAFAQNPPPSQSSSDATTSTGQKQPSQRPDRVTTTVVVHGEVKDDYISDPRTAASLDNTPLQETPLAVTSVTSAVIGDQISRILADVVKNDASVGEDYAPVGYY